VVSAVLALSSPLFWFHGEVALSYIVEGFFVTVIAFCCYQQLRGDAKYAMLTALALGIAGGFRQNTLVLLSPLWLFCLWRLKWRERLIAVATLGVTVGVWMLTMFYLSGGVANYLGALAGQAQSNALGNTPIGIATRPEDWLGGSNSILTNVLRLIVYGFYTLTIGWPLAAIAFGWTASRWRDWIGDPRWQVLWLWIMPSAGFYALFVQQAGYVFTFAPAVVLVLSSLTVDAFAVTPQGRSRRWAEALIGATIVANVAFFLTAPPFLFNQKRQLFSTPSWPAIYNRNLTVSEKLNYIYEHFPPETTAVLASQFDFRLPDYYFRDYQTPSLSRQVNGAASDVAPGEAVRVLVLFDDDIAVRADSQSTVREASLVSGEKLRWLERTDDQEFRVSAVDVSVRDK
jgi:hypothetical protein